MSVAEIPEEGTEEAEFVHECGVTVRPCPRIECRQNLVQIDRGREESRRRPFSEPLAVDRSESCVYDVIEKYGSQSLEAVGQRLGLCRERVRQIEEAALTKLYAIALERERTGGEL